jgi:hypothetical protein
MAKKHMAGRKQESFVCQSTIEAAAIHNIELPI